MLKMIIDDFLQSFINEVEPQIARIDGPDYYISQSNIKLEPELLIIGINPAGEKKLSESEFKNKRPRDLIYSSNQYLENPNWTISKKLNFIFSDKHSQDAYRDAVIINCIAINTKKDSDLKKQEYKEVVDICKDFSKRLIYNLIKPKKILILGPSVAKHMKINFHSIEDSVLRTKDEKSYLVLEKLHNNIPHYLIYHPSTPALNGSEHLQMKRQFFNNLFQKNYA